MNLPCMTNQEYESIKDTSQIFFCWHDINRGEEEEVGIRHSKVSLPHKHHGGGGTNPFQVNCFSIYSRVQKFEGKKNSKTTPKKEMQQISVNEIALTSKRRPTSTIEPSQKSQKLVEQVI